MNRKKVALFVLVLVLIVAVIWSIGAIPRQKTVSTLKYVSGQKAQVVRPVAVPAAIKPAVQIADERILRLDLLEREQGGFKGYRRNIFKPIFIDEVKAMMRKAAASKPLPLPPVTAKVEPPKIEPPKIDPPPVGGQPDVLKATLARFVFLGYLKKDSRKTIFLSKDKDIILVRKGDRFAGKYEARNITDQALTIVATDTNEETVIPLIENQPLSAVARK